MKNFRILGIVVFIGITAVYLSGNAIAAEGKTTPGTWDILQTAITDFTNLAWPGATALAAVGLLTMTIVEFLKGVNFVVINPFYRGNFHRKMFKELIPSETTRGQIILLATAGDKEALYDLPIAKFTGQINAAMQVVLLNPSKYEAILRAMAYGADESDVKLLLEPDEAEAKFKHGRNRVTNLIQRKLDAIQISWGNRWIRRLQRLSIGISVVIIASCGFWFFSTNQDSEITLGVLFFWVVIAVVGGAFAPVAKNLVTGLKSLKERAK